MPSPGHVRIGTGLDVHAFADDPRRPLILAGVEIAGPGLAGHSDADVLVHAVTDAVLGAAGLGDLGGRFGTDRPDVAGARSIDLLRDLVAELDEAGWRIGNVDCTVVAQRPRLAAHQDELRRALADALGVERDRASVKVTSTDGLGSIGRGEGMACWASALLHHGDEHPAPGSGG